MDLLHQEVADKVATKQVEQKQQHDLKANPRELMVGPKSYGEEHVLKS